MTTIRDFDTCATQFIDSTGQIIHTVPDAALVASLPVWIPPHPTPPTDFPDLPHDARRAAERIWDHAEDVRGALDASDEATTATEQAEAVARILSLLCDLEDEIATFRRELSPAAPTTSTEPATP